MCGYPSFKIPFIVIRNDVELKKKIPLKISFVYDLGTKINRADVGFEMPQ